MRFLERWVDPLGAAGPPQKPVCHLRSRMTEKPEEKGDADEALETAEATEPEEEAVKIEGLETEVNETGPCKVEVKVRVPTEAIDTELARTFDELTPNATIPGFRRGHAPRKLVERHYHDTAFEDVKRMLIARSWDQMKEEREIRPVGDPDLSDDKIEYDKEKGLSYSLEIEIAPKFDIKNYKGLKLTRPCSEIKEEEISETIDKLRRRNAVLEPVEKGATKQDDVPVVDCDITVAGEVVHSISDQEIALGPDNWLRGLDEEMWKDLLGKKTGKAVKKTVTLPDTYQKEQYRGKEAEVTVTIKDIKRPRLPELNDEFAKDLLYENLDALRNDVRERIAAAKERQSRTALAAQVEEKLLEMVHFDLPENLLQRMTERTVNRQRLNLAYQGVPRDEIEKAASQLVEGAQQKTERDMHIYFILQQVAEKENITVGDTEFERRIQMMAQLQGVRAARFREDLRREGRLELLRSEIQDEKTMEFLIAEAKVTETAGDAESGKKSRKSKRSSRKAEASSKAEESEGKK